MLKCKSVFLCILLRYFQLKIWLAYYAVGCQWKHKMQQVLSQGKHVTETIDAASIRNRPMNYNRCWIQITKVSTLLSNTIYSKYDYGYCIQVFCKISAVQFCYSIYSILRFFLCSTETCFWKWDMTRYLEVWKRDLSWPGVWTLRARWYILEQLRIFINYLGQAGSSYSLHVYKQGQLEWTGSSRRSTKV